MNAGLQLVLFLLCGILPFGMSGCAGKSAPGTQGDANAGAPAASVPPASEASALTVPFDPGAASQTRILVYNILTMDLSLPQLERQWVRSEYKLDRQISDTDLFALVWDATFPAQAGQAPEADISKRSASEDGYPVYVFDFAGTQAPEEQLLHNLCGTFSENGRRQLRCLFALNGEPITDLLLTSEGYYSFLFYEAIPDVGYYTAAEIRALQRQLPLDLQRREPLRLTADGYWEGTPPEEEALTALNAFLDGEGDPVRARLSVFLDEALPGEHNMIDYTAMQFDDPKDAPNELLVIAGLKHTRMLLDYRQFEGAPATPEETMYVINRNTQQVVYGWPGDHVERAAQYYYGSNIAIAHQGYGIKRYGYYEWTHLYSHFPGGTGGEFAYFPVLAYKDLGEQYEVTVSILYGFAGMAGPQLFTKEGEALQTEIPWEAALDYAKNEAARARVTLNKLEDGRLTVQSFHYLGFPTA